MVPMGYWASVLMAVGAVLLGVGLGLTLGQRRERMARRQQRRVEAQVARDLLPLLEEQAEALGIRLPSGSRSPVDEAAALARELRRLHHRQEVAFSDTVDARAADLSEQELGEDTTGD